MAEPIRVHVKVDGKALEKLTVGILWYRLTKAAYHLESVIKTSMSISNLKGKNPSKPGEVPHVGTGTLKRSITTKWARLEENSIVSRVGIIKGPAFYGRILELGSTKMKKRPFLLPALKNSEEAISKIVRGG